MPAIEAALLPSELRPLLSTFYRSQGSSMRAVKGARYWVARQSREIVAGLCLTAVAEGYWLTGLLVRPTERGQGVASTLLRHVLKSEGTVIWLFCHPQLTTFYTTLGFEAADALPQNLDERLQRYTRSKPLVALRHVQSSTQTGAFSEPAHSENRHRLPVR